MKKLLFLASLIFALTTSFTLPTSRMVIHGTVEDSTLNGTEVVLYNYDTQKKVEKTTVKDGKFTFTVDPDSFTILRIDLKPFYTNVIADNGTVNVDLKKDQSRQSPMKVSGTPLNEQFCSYLAEQKSLTDAYYEKYKELDVKSDSIDAMKVSLYNIYIADTKKIADKYLQPNRNNGLGVFVIWENILSIYNSVSRLDSVLAMSPKASSFSMIKEWRNDLVNKEKTDEGKMFLDFDAVKVSDGSPVRLSDYVGKGKYVLVDFWASWCGPCREEIPNIRNNYLKYKDKGLVVLGMNVWDKKEKCVKTVADEKMTWENIADWNDEKAAKTYGINGIPHIILFAPDGKILKRNLRGDEIGKTLAKIYKD